MKKGRLILKHTVEKWHFFQEILNFQHLHETIEMDHQNYKGWNDQSLFFQHNQFYLLYQYYQKLHYYLINLQH